MGRPARADARLNRIRLLDAAREVLAERGFDADVTEIASRAGVGAGTVYRHFASKDALILAVAEEMVEKTNRDTYEVALSAKDAPEGVRMIMQVGFQRVKEYGQLAISMVAGVNPPQFDGVVNREQLASVYRSLVRRGIQEGFFRVDVDVDYAVAVWFAITAPNALGELMKQRSVDEIAQLTTEWFLAGLYEREVPR